MKNLIKKISFTIFLIMGVSFFSPKSVAQFKKDAFRQSYNNDSDSTNRDSVAVVFTFKDYFGGLAHKHESKIGVVFAGSTIFIGGEQIYNKQYWKLPIVYGSLATSIGLGYYYNKKWNRTGDNKDKFISNVLYAGAGLVYWGTLMDGIINYKKEKYPQPGKATIYSILLPGLGQAYNGEYWKIPIYYGCLIGAAHFLYVNNLNYHRFKKIHNEATTPGNKYDGPIPANRALFYRNAYRRLRDYSIVTLVGFYLLQVIDANVFSYMQDFDMSNNISLNISPTIITNNLELASNSSINTQYKYIPSPIGINAVGFKIGLRF